MMFFALSLLAVINAAASLDCETLGDLCYFISFSNVYGDEQAYACRLLHPDAEPVSIHSEEVNSFLLSMSSGHSPWIGLRRKSADEDYAWIDGSSVDFTNWKQEPDHDSKNYGYLSNADGKWLVDDSEDPGSHFCQVKLQ